MSLFLLACRYEPPVHDVVPNPPVAPRFTAPCESLMPLRVGHSVQPPEIVERVAPKHVGVNATVIIALIVDSQGGVCDAVVVRGVGRTGDQAALEAVRQWRFRPALLNGVPRAAVFHVTVKLTRA